MLVNYLFPGQGSQYHGMIRTLSNNLKEVKEVFEVASDIYGKDIEILCKTATDHELQLTQNTQVAVLTMSIAYLRLLENREIYPNIVAGHSLGQYAAMVASRIISFENALEIVLLRSKMMSEIKRKGTMYAVLGVDDCKIREVCEKISDEYGQVSIALYNTNSQIVIGGDELYVVKACEELKKLGALRVTQLSVSQAFHTPLMKDMIKPFAELVDKLQIKTPKCNIVLNSTGDYETDKEAMRRELVNQCTYPVLWKHSMNRILHNKDSVFVEVGSGKTLTGMMRSISNTTKVYALDDAKHFKKFVVMMSERREGKKEGQTA
ncbi:ACP S-malonyltransferase [Herbivorax sp. ANBcel31]|uniref:ACP S-malonyltransferase n=1 Tax=Herbivorax sp. ANBcel31 TaxID=3069754 RepID=UPI0027AEF08B|nr:ACP S-malonyltransferase [Herbivorax sp. ANBcel31]MDQ2085429.1 ACP S-malonyltransferase [Herbivorax sp. ANBcel31]